MIPAYVVEDFVDGRRDDHRSLKALKHADLDRLMAELRPPPKLYPKLGLHQKVCIALGIAYPRFSFWVDMGGGKTLITLELLRYWYKQGIVRRALVFVKSDKAFPTWEKQRVQYGIEDVPIVTLEGSSVQKWRQLERFGTGIVLLTYPGAVAMVSDRGGKLAKKAMTRLAKDVDAVIMDESTKCGNPGSLTHRLVRRLAKQVEVCHALAGRPFGRDPQMLWAQQLIVDGGDSLGETVGLFRAAFYKASDNEWAASDYAKNYEFRKALQPELTRLLQHRSITYASDECVDLPPLRAIVEEVTFDEELRAYYKLLVKQVMEARGNFREMKNAFIRMRQLSSGFIGYRDDETGQRAEVSFAGNPKLERMLELADELPEDRKAVIFYEFTYSGRRLHEELNKAGIGNIWLWGGNKDYRRDLELFTDDPKCRIAAVNSKVGAYSLDGLQVANYLFFYESPVPVIDRDQAQRRVLRQGQLRKVFQYDLVVKNTMDRRILQFHKEGQDLLKMLLHDPAVVLAGNS